MDLHFRFSTNRVGVASCLSPEGEGPQTVSPTICIFRCAKETLPYNNNSNNFQPPHKPIESDRSMEEEEEEEEGRKDSFTLKFLSII